MTHQVDVDVITSELIKISKICLSFVIQNEENGVYLFFSVPIGGFLFFEQYTGHHSVRTTLLGFRRRDAKQVLFFRVKK